MRRFVLLTPLILIPLTACEEILDEIRSDQEAFAQDAMDAVAITQAEAALVAAVVDGLDLASEDTDAMATAAAAAAATTFTPAECVQAVAAGSTVTYTFDSCAGPRGLAAVSGVANVSFSVPATESVTVSLTSSDLAASDTVGTVNATGTYSVEGEEPVLMLTTSGVAQASTGEVLGRAGAYTATFDASCIGLEGQWTTTVNDETFWITGVQGYRSCAGACPESGSVAHGQVDNPDATTDPFEGDNILIKLNGKDTAPFVDSDGKPGSVTMDCEP